DDALMVFLGDHGEMNCERGLVDKGVYGHPKTALVPLSVKLPGERGVGRTIEAPVSLLDVAPTVLGLAGVEPAERLDGESLVPLITGDKARRNEPFIFECGWHVCPNPAVSWFDEIDGRLWMYTYNLTSDFDELYDVDNRSYANMSDDPDCAGVRAEMIRRLGAFLEADPRWACYWHTFRLDRYEYLDVGSGDFQMFKPER
ncbi:MAG: sulfatase-like hydrolase/transferase, partial [Armatimonadetes bacterium]|nr:sulfatase-like hydrolase/transferase [Armatimonadota bacterium]